MNLFRTFLITFANDRFSVYEHNNEPTEEEAIMRVVEKYPDYNRIINLSKRDKTEAYEANTTVAFTQH